MSYASKAAGARNMGDYFTLYDFRANPRCPFCNEPWSSQKVCGEPDPLYEGGWKGMAERRKIREGKV